MLMFWSEVRDSLVNWLSTLGRLDLDARLDLGDKPGQYRLVGPTEVRRVLAADPRVRRELYAAGAYDCEDFAMAARSALAFHAVTGPYGRDAAPVAFGVLFTSVHAVNVGVDDGGRPYLYDATTDEVWDGALHDAFRDRFPNGWLSAATLRYVIV